MEAFVILAAVTIIHDLLAALNIKEQIPAVGEASGAGSVQSRTAGSVRAEQDQW